MELKHLSFSLRGQNLDLISLLAMALALDYQTVASSLLLSNVWQAVTLPLVIDIVIAVIAPHGQI